MSDFGAHRRLRFKRILAAYRTAGVRDRVLAEVVCALAPGGASELELIGALDPLSPVSLLAGRRAVDVRELMEEGSP